MQRMVTKSVSIFKSLTKQREADQIVRPEHVVVTMDNSESIPGRQ